MSEHPIDRQVLGYLRAPSADVVQILLPAVAMVAMLAVIFSLRPAAFSYFGFNLLFNLSVPLIFSALSQMLVINAGDIDLSNGAFVSFVTCVVAVFLAAQPLLAVVILAGSVAIYAAVGILIQVRKLPSIIVTLGMSFVWLGLALLVLPTPGGLAPEWLIGLTRFKPPLMPLPLWVALIAAVVGHWALVRSSYGVILRGAGGNPVATARAGWSLATARVVIYTAAGALAALSGLALSAITTSGDPDVAPAYTLLGIGAVILGGGSFTGGLVSPIGTVVGAITLSLAGSLLSFLQVPSVWQIGAQGLILFLVLAGRAFTSRRAA